MLFWEKHYPWLIAVIAILVMAFVDFVSEWDAGFPAGAANLLGASVTGGSIFTAFLATMLSFLMGLDTPAARRVFETKFGNLLLSYFKHGIVGSLVFFLVSLFGYFRQDAIVFYIWAFFGFFATCTFWRCANLLFLLVRKSDTKH